MAALVGGEPLLPVALVSVFLGVAAGGVWGGTGSFPRAPCTSTGLVSLLFPLPCQVLYLQLAGGGMDFLLLFLILSALFGSILPGFSSEL